MISTRYSGAVRSHVSGYFTGDLDSLVFMWVSPVLEFDVTIAFHPLVSGVHIRCVSDLRRAAPTAVRDRSTVDVQAKCSLGKYGFLDSE